MNFYEDRKASAGEGFIEIKSSRLPLISPGMGNKDGIRGLSSVIGTI